VNKGATGDGSCGIPPLIFDGSKKINVCFIVPVVVAAFLDNERALHG
jgi:hypothetical protein